ncbi:hypothetical protein [Planomicrobium okeanokoites]|uniref:Uncharacterized protein n=1 Tax=Planomicrobium okeanokoites TaxID=244 RepID=A0ABV7KTI7_PLAOK|nr:hypothetical protein [Planomicrobium okeanokoites]
MKRQLEIFSLFFLFYIFCGNCDLCAIREFYARLEELLLKKGYRFLKIYYG